MDDSQNDHNEAAPAYQELVTIGAFIMPYEADIARSILESEEIPAFLMDYHTIYIKWLYSLALGGIKLQVHRNDVELAKEVIQSALVDSKHAAPEYSEGICPRCGSGNSSPAVFGRQWAVFTWLIVGIPLIWPWIRLRCADCGKRWRDV